MLPENKKRKESIERTDLARASAGVCYWCMCWVRGGRELTQVGWQRFCEAICTAAGGDGGTGGSIGGRGGSFGGGGPPGGWSGGKGGEGGKGGGAGGGGGGLGSGRSGCPGANGGAGGGGKDGLFESVTLPLFTICIGKQLPSILSKGLVPTHSTKSLIVSCGAVNVHDTTDALGKPRHVLGISTSAYSSPCTVATILDASGAQRAFAASCDTYDGFISCAIA